MKRAVTNEAFRILSSYPDTNWQDCLYVLFSNACEVNDDVLVRDVFFSIVIETIRTHEKWMIEELTDLKNEDKPYLNLKRLGLYQFGMNILKTIPQKKSPGGAPLKYVEQEYSFKKSFWAQFRKTSHYDLCACCHEFVLTRAEIQNFPLQNDESYIRECFEKAFGQKELHKRKFVLDYMLSNYSETNPKILLLLELWEKTEASGAHIEPVSCHIPAEVFLDRKYFKSFVSIINFRDHEHDSLIDDLVLILLEKNRQSLALFLNAKLSTPKERIFSAICNVLNKKDPIKDDLLFLRRVADSIRHEKVTP